MRNVKYNKMNIIKEYANANRTTVAVLGTMEDEIIVCEFQFTKDAFFGNHLKTFEDDNKNIHFRGKNTKMNRDEAEETYEECVRGVKDYDSAS